MYITTVAVAVAALFPLVFSVPLPTSESEIADASAIPVIADTSPPAYPFVEDIVLNKNPRVPDGNLPIENILLPRNPNELDKLFNSDESSSLAPTSINRNKQDKSKLPPLELIVPQVSNAPDFTGIPQTHSSHPPIPPHSIAADEPVTPVYAHFPGLHNYKETRKTASSSESVTSADEKARTTHNAAESMSDSLRMKISEHVLDIRDEYIKVALRLDEDQQNQNSQVYDSMFDHLGSVMEDMSRRLKDEGLVMNEDK